MKKVPAWSVIKKVERTTGLSVVVEPTIYKGDTEGYACYEEGRPRLNGYGKTPGEAGEEFILRNYREVFARAVSDQLGKCLFCAGVFEPLECHHIVPRARGRNDKRENLVASCHRCHQLITDGSKLVPNARMEKALEMRGWRYTPKGLIRSKDA